MEFIIVLGVLILVGYLIFRMFKGIFGGGSDIKTVLKKGVTPDIWQPTDAEVSLANAKKAYRTIIKDSGRYEDSLEIQFEMESFF